MLKREPMDILFRPEIIRQFWIVLNILLNEKIIYTGNIVWLNNIKYHPSITMQSPYCYRRTLLKEDRSQKLPWTKEALSRLERVHPFVRNTPFVRNMAKKTINNNMLFLKKCIKL